MTIFLMFFIELMTARFDVFGGHEHAHDLEAAAPVVGSNEQLEKCNDGSGSTSKYQALKHFLPFDDPPSFTSTSSGLLTISLYSIHFTFETNQLLIQPLSL